MQQPFLSPSYQLLADKSYASLNGLCPMGVSVPFMNQTPAKDGFVKSTPTEEKTEIAKDDKVEISNNNKAEENSQKSEEEVIEYKDYVPPVQTYNMSDFMQETAKKPAN